MKRYGMKPDRPSGHYSRLLGQKLGFAEAEKKLYKVPLAGTRKHDLARSPFSIFVRLPHELIQKEVEADPSQKFRLQEMKDANALPASYTQNPIVTQSDPNDFIIPISIYMDGVAYTITDSVVGVWAINGISQTRHLLMLIRKRLGCRCGCRSWCTFAPLMAVLRWSLDCLSRGIYPSERHDGTAWDPAQDAIRATRSGQQMAARACTMWFKADWAEFCERLGFPTWTSASRPCFCCGVSKQELFNPGQVLDRLNMDMDYERS
eukprot:10743803-Alexandrium_andersonii.AAC.1